MNKLLKPAVLVLLVSVTGVLLNFFLLKFLARTAPDVLATWASFDLLIMAALAVCLYGGEQTTILAVHSKKPIADVSSSVTVSLLIYVLLFAPLAFFYLYEVASLSVFEAIIFCFACGTIVFTYHVSFVLRGKGFYIKSAVIERLTVFFAILFLLVAFFLGIDFELASLLLISAVLVLFISLFFIYKAGVIYSVREGWVNSWNFIRNRNSIFIYSTLIFAFVYDRLDQILLTGFMDKNIVASYFVCYKLAFFVKFISRSFNQIFFSVMAGAAEDRDNAKEALKVNFLVNHNFSFVFALLLIVCSEHLLDFFLIHEFEYGLVLSVLGLAFFLSSYSQVAFNYVNASGGGKYFLKNGVLVVVIQLIFGLFLFLWAGIGVFSFALAKFFSNGVGAFNAFFALKSQGYRFCPGKIFLIELLILIFIMLMKLEWV